MRECKLNCILRSSVITSIKTTVSHSSKVNIFHWSPHLSGNLRDYCRNVPSFFMATAKPQSFSIRYNVASYYEFTASALLRFCSTLVSCFIWQRFPCKISSGTTGDFRCWSWANVSRLHASHFEVGIEAFHLLPHFSRTTCLYCR